MPRRLAARVAVCGRCLLTCRRLPRHGGVPRPSCRQPALPDQRPTSSGPDIDRPDDPAAARPAAPPVAAERSAEVVHHPARFLRDRLPIGADHAIQALLLLIPAAWAVIYLFPPINHDVAALMDVVHRWLNGEQLYVDIIDVNLPLVFVF